MGRCEILGKRGLKNPQVGEKMSQFGIVIVKTLAQTADVPRQAKPAAAKPSVRSPLEALFGFI